MFVIKKPHKCLSYMRGFEKQSASFFEKNLQFINEMFFIDEYLIQQERIDTYDSNNQKELNIERFIYVNQHYDDFLSKTEDITLFLIDFW